ncbi:MAG: hypothetical protein JXA69_17950 [Phycisphaerae bacterium]|nr:hypothetical protein [Phycisphaerae bacterium]
MPSITYWNRVEPRPRSPHLQRSLSAQIRDPLWFLTRQWQFGEFQGEDAASPAYVQFAARFSPVNGWRASDGYAVFQAFNNQTPLEALVETEPFTPDVATAVELGQRFESLLAGSDLEERVRRDLIQSFRDAYRIVRPSFDALNAMPDQELARFLRVCAGRAIDGIALYRAVHNALPNLPDAPPIGDPAQSAVVRQLAARFHAWVQAVFGDLTVDDAPAWRPERLEYGVQASAITPTGGRAVFNAYAGRQGEYEWYAFDQRPGPDGDEAGRPAVETVTRSLLPINVRFRGMPNARWWHFESGSTDFGGIQVEPGELAKVVLIDFMLVHSNDWFVVPFAQRVGTLCRIDALLVHDVFGDTTVVDRADRGAASATGHWSMFSTAIEGDEDALADFFILSPTAVASTLDGEVLEEVRFLRDEMANMVWAIEHTTENGVGRPWSGHERAQAGPAEEPVAGAEPIAPLKYSIQSTVPEHWIPFLPVLIDQATRDIALERAALLHRGEGGEVRPVGRVLQPTRLADRAIYRVREEEVTRPGVRVSRVVRRSRWLDGSTHLWIARKKTAGAGEGSSGLRFDMAIPFPAGEREE